ncbi:MAG: hypothetical protein A2700_00190 [Candidatus Blackburnbacteria bacterium RIFCSPHIGHO2_01_FULL_44_64]|uniref:DUF86 domain-containing protein n=1 Tax=Candidatus Blackburnbacteria bacterium RIFCSPHIGHO2_02_FULL_44_20 TaxID=1797516 RepID=A0A1G1V8C4_9BACT|nr:MAG: hypothetical protein A2700_00190 [Candidatus Blackburnbacteria bacterium RIFCSPHIGHO2_01_FULL_44_64]OGY11162.1 MAG: hypothetical protein A3E16_01340 [Candidatus Blackburnbacteria bacterium RIFCSPHIGHO2_12_FULL_44_25]OGY11557.1 MAG: hypothetical protein A3D26_03335 [Candidatus Blackburnbacteria bacterium RIFCSPHIGHO2_02_FULL_44_20]OGY14113.1 MAG: hypothetical protein A3A62_02000 [Candidatus Blackburnbacteria bacterium RIFCSPLOWO2_01_FULL_44_43]OGY15771.1 MAG: hypothetical protein A3H88_0
MTKEPKIFLQHILESIELIEKRVVGVTFDEFSHNLDLQDMVIRRLEVVGEAVRNLPKDFRDKYRSVSWQDPAGMRSALIHGYFQVDLEVVWDTIRNDLPTFKKEIGSILKKLK